MKKILCTLSYLMLCFIIVGCGQSGLGKYKWGSALETTLDKIGITDIKEVKEDTVEGVDSVVFVNFTSGGKKLNSYMSKDNGKWSTVTVSGEGKYYYDTTNGRDVYDFGTGKLVKKSEKKKEPKKTEEPKVAEPTMGQKNASSAAKKYLNYTAFSYTGLIKQLQYEGYSAEDSTYAADKCGADWSQQAASSAKRYIEFSSYSRQGLIDQLIYEGYTQEQAEYGVTSVGY